MITKGLVIKDSRPCTPTRQEIVSDRIVPTYPNSLYRTILMNNKQSLSKRELEIRVRELENEYAYTLSLAGLGKGMITTIMAMVSGLLTLIAALIAFLWSGPGFLSGTHLVIIFGILAAAIIIYFSFVFGRAAKIRAEISETKKLIEVSSGDKAR